jgi:transcription elongation GreA/GreB family factor
LTIDFEENSGQVMDLQFAIQKTEPLAADDFRARQLEEIEELRHLADKDPVGLVVRWLETHGGATSVDSLEKQLSPAVIPADQFKRWWENAKRLLKDSKRVAVPSKRSSNLILRDAALSPAQVLVADFEAAHDLKSMAKALEAIAGDLRLFEDDPDALKRLLKDIDQACRSGLKRQPGAVLELLAIRDEIVGSAKTLEVDPGAVTVAEVVRAEFKRLPDAMTGIAPSRQRAVFEAFPAAFGEAWIERILEVFDKVGSRGVAEIAKVLERDSDRMARLEAHLTRALSGRVLGPDALIWVCREREGIAAGVFGPEVGGAILHLLELDHMSDGPRRTVRLQGILHDDAELLGDLVRTMDATEARNFARRLLECPVFGDLDKKSLMARVIKACPDTGELVSGESGRRSVELVVSWESLERKRTELDDLIRNRIPQNTRDIAIARSYGDLRENFEYKSAREMQKVLVRRKSELQRDLDRARGTDFRGADTSCVNIGTVVTLVDETGVETEYAVLGAWDSDPEHHKVSYLSEIGAALIGGEPGRTVRARDPLADMVKSFTVKAIRAWATD